MSRKFYLVTLTDEERSELRSLIARGKAAAYRLLHARILLKADAAPGGPAWTDARIAEALETSRLTVERLRKRFVEEGPAACLARKPQAERARKVTGDLEARLVALACAKPPEGRATWTLQLLADRLVTLGIRPAISRETVRRTLKKTNSSLG
jgi:transposase